MAKRSNLLSLAEAIELWKQKSGWGDDLIAFQISQNLSVWLGPSFSQDIHSVTFKQGLLTLFVRNPVVQHELVLSQKVLENTLNRQLSQAVIQKITVQIADT